MLGNAVLWMSLNGPKYGPGWQRNSHSFFSSFPFECQPQLLNSSRQSGYPEGSQNSYPGNQNENTLDCSDPTMSALAECSNYGPYRIRSNRNLRVRSYLVDMAVRPPIQTTIIQIRNNSTDNLILRTNPLRIRLLRFSFLLRSL